MGSRGPLPVYDADDRYVAVRLPGKYIKEVDEIAGERKTSRSKVLRERLLRDESNSNQLSESA